METAMTRTTALDVSHLPTFASGSRAPLWWGILFLVIIEAIVFSTFIATYFYLRFHAPNWPPAGEPLPELLLPTINTLVLIGSSLAVYYADSGISKEGDVKRLKIGISLAIVFSATFLVLKVVEYHDSDYFWDTHAYGSIVWTMVIFHSAHVASVLLKGIVVLVMAFRGHFTRYRHLGVQVNGIYWHFVVGIWIPLYLTIYWTPRIA
jgi:cytochrome c oxidase subunit III